MLISHMHLALISSMVAICVGCGQVPLTDSLTMNDSESNELKVVQAKLDETLRNHSPFVFDELASPATDAEVAKLRSELNGADCPHLESWFRWHNGCANHPMGLLPLGSLLSIDESIEDRSAIQNVPFVHERRKRDIKLLDDGAGDGFFLDLTKSPPRIYYEMLEDPIPTDFGTMMQFLQFIDRVHAAGIASVNEHGIVDFDDAGYQRLEDDHLASVKTNGR